MFFKEIYDCMTPGATINLSIQKGENKLIVLVVAKASNKKDEQQKVFIPMTVAGTPEELDAEFSKIFREPLKKSASLIVNANVPDKPAQNSKDNSVKDNKAKYDQAFKKGEELEKQKKYKEAQACYEEAKTFGQPSNMKVINDKITSMKSWAGQGNLFAGLEPEQNANPKSTETVEPEKKPMDITQLPGEQIDDKTPSGFEMNKLPDLPGILPEIKDLDDVVLPPISPNYSFDTNYNNAPF